MTEIERFVGRVDFSGDCHQWTGGLSTPGGYGWFHDRKSVYAHRWSYETFVGPADGMVLHRCDNPRCVNPDHLYLGDHTANMKDMASRGRSLQGSRHHKAKLLEADAIAIRADDRVQGEIAEEYGVSQSTVSLIQLGKTWRHING